jgi:hypothetical protein
MNEQAARDVALIRAIETADAEGALLTADDRRYAGRAAVELAHWRASEQRRAATPELFLERRADLLLDRLGARDPVLRALRPLRWRPWLGWLLPGVAFVLGALSEQVANRQHLNVLAFPLLGIIAWNLAVYALMLMRPLLGRGAGPIRRWLADGRWRRAATVESSAALRRFAGDWAALSAPLLDARAGRVLHLSAALLAIGAVAGLYLRALAFEYRIGWESTYLQPATVHAILQAVLGPAARLLGTSFPPVEAIAAMRITGGSGGVDAGPWIHLYAVTVGLTVIAPRLLFAAWARWRERRLADGFRFDLGEPYFRRVLAPFAPTRARLRVAPYSYSLDTVAVSGLTAVARHLFGDTTDLAMQTSVDYGSEAAAAVPAAVAADDVSLALAVFNAAATPEAENHGRFLEALRAAAGVPLAVVVDTAPYRRRLGAQPDRLAERCTAWQAFVAARGLPVACIDLEAPDLAQAERALAPAFGAPA